MLKGTTVKINLSQNRVMIRQSGGNNPNNISKDVRREREKKLIGIKFVKPGIIPSISLLKIAPGVP